MVLGRTYRMPNGAGLRLSSIHPHSGQGEEREVTVTYVLLNGPVSGQQKSAKWSYLLEHGLKADSSKPTCRCLAYKFPHHRGLGRCKEPK